LREIVTSLKAGYPTLCVSTQLIECGVDISFGAASRLTAGLDNLLQTAGRCNRHQQNREPGLVYIVRAKPEDLPDALADIKIAREKMLRILDEFSTEGETPDLNQPQVIERYFQYYFYERRKEMSYPVRRPAHIRDDTLLSMLSCNALAVTLPGHTSLKQSFAAANKLYQVIPNFTMAIIVPYQDEGKKLIADLGSAWEPLRHKDLLRKAQQYSLNIFHHIWQKLAEAGALHNIQESGIYNLSESYYDDQHLGLLVDGGAKASTLLL
jgi:CRISPR-associated endonuclease/helicase Cas3